MKNSLLKRRSDEKFYLIVHNSLNIQLDKQKVKKILYFITSHYCSQSLYINDVINTSHFISKSKHSSERYKPLRTDPIPSWKDCKFSKTLQIKVRQKSKRLSRFSKYVRTVEFEYFKNMIKEKFINEFNCLYGILYIFCLIQLNKCLKKLVGCNLSSYSVNIDIITKY